MKFNVFKANLAKVSADAIVLPTNERLKETHGVSEAVFKAAGKKHLQKTCEEIGYCAVGSAVPTLAYKLNADYIVHTVVPEWKDGKHGEYALLASAYLSALQIADLMGCESIAVPLLTYGANGFDEELSVSIAKKTILEFYGKNLKKIALILRMSQSDSTTKTFGLTVLTYSKENGETRLLIDRKDSTKIVLVGAKQFAQQILRDQTKKVAAWFKDKDNQKKLIASGILIAAALMKDKKEEK